MYTAGTFKKKKNCVREGGKEKKEKKWQRPD